LPREVQLTQLEVVTQPPNRMVEILEFGYAEFERRHPLPGYVREAARMAIHCRTSTLGGHVEKCPDGHLERVWYNSCGHRFCPRCAYRKQQHWLHKERTHVLPVRHFHVTFTIPHAFNDLWWGNFKEMATLLFRTAAQALQELLRDPERVGVQVGITAALHTWDDQMLRHPHLHCLVTGGGLTPEGEWKESFKPGDKPFLVSVKALMQRFRKLFCRRLERKIKQGRLTLPQGCRPQQRLNLINQVNQTNWQVHIKKPPEDGGPTTEEILQYQAQAVAGGPISPLRIEHIERKIATWTEAIHAAQEPQLRYISEAPMTDHRIEAVDLNASYVTFCWGKYDQETGRRGRDKTATVTVEEFIRRVLFHVTPPDFQAIRHYGLYTSTKKKEREQLRELLPDVPEADVEQHTASTKARKDEGRVSLDEYMEQRSHCPVCGKRLVLSHVIPSSASGKISPRDKARVGARRRGG
jgi:hypothetical protein